MNFKKALENLCGIRGEPVSQQVLHELQGLGFRVESGDGRYLVLEYQQNKVLYDPEFDCIADWRNKDRPKPRAEFDSHGFYIEGDGK